MFPLAPGLVVIFHFNSCSNRSSSTLLPLQGRAKSWGHVMLVLLMHPLLHYQPCCRLITKSSCGLKWNVHDLHSFASHLHSTYFLSKNTDICSQFAPDSPTLPTWFSEPLSSHCLTNSAWATTPREIGGWTRPVGMGPSPSLPPTMQLEPTPGYPSLASMLDVG